MSSTILSAPPLSPRPPAATSRFVGLRMSDPRHEREGLRFATLESPSLGGRGDICFFVPPRGEGCQLPLVLLLHGAYGSHWMWAFRGGAHRIAADLIHSGKIGPMVLAMPADGYWGASSGYFTQTWADYEAWILDEVVGCAREQIPGVGPHAPVFLAGLSMGAFGALRLGAKYADRVAGISAHSTVPHLEQLAIFAEPGSRLPPAPSPGEADVMCWLRRNKDVLPPIRLDCGTSDPLCEPNRRLHAALTAEGIAHRHEEYEGGHDWDYWSRRLPDTLTFFDQISRSTTKPPKNT